METAGKITRVRPIVKWAGGKSQLLGELSSHLPDTFGRYFEPFGGSAALLFHLQPRRATLADANDELMNCYRVVKNDVENLIADLSTHENRADYFYATRAVDPAVLDEIERASRFIYLNRTCFNGLYRVNRRGQFNTPFGAYRNPRICDADNLRAASMLLRDVELLDCDYRDALALAEAGDFVYLDPPYVPVSQFSDFKRYTKEQFREEDHSALALVFRDLDERGCRVMLSNSSVPLVRDLYGGFNIEIVQARRLINRNVSGRGCVDELIIRNYG
ncbi:MAG: DNA adenine methylase [Thermoleophilia bacterium]